MQQIAVHAVSVPESPMSIYWLDWALNIVIESGINAVNYLHHGLPSPIPTPGARL